MNQITGELFDRLQTEYQLKKVDLEILGHKIQLYKVRNLDELLDQVTDPDEIPFWAELWPASVSLAKFILERPLIFQNQNVLELGAGVGLAGMAVKMAGARTTQSDFFSPALEFCRLNCRLNELPEDPFLQADWRKFPEEAGRFDRIIGSDILYERTLHDCLLEVLAHHLEDGGKVILADPGRDHAKIFLKQAVEEGWTCETSIVPVFYEARTYQIQVHQLTMEGKLSL